MPKIATYSAPTEALSESTRGDQAWEQAGRRLGPLYNETAQFQREQGAAEAQQIKQLLWPMSMVRLLEAQAAYNSGSSAVGGRVTDTGGQGHLSASSPSYAGHGQISRGAGALGNALRDGGYALASKDPEAMTLYEGDLVKSSYAKEKQRELNAHNDAANSDFLKKQIADYNENYTGNPYATDRTNPDARSYEGGNTDSAAGGDINDFGPRIGAGSTSNGTDISDSGTSYYGGGSNWLSGLSDWASAGTPNAPETSY